MKVDVLKHAGKHQLPQAARSIYYGFYILISEMKSIVASSVFHRVSLILQLHTNIYETYVFCVARGTSWSLGIDC